MRITPWLIGSAVGVVGGLVAPLNGQTSLKAQTITVEPASVSISEQIDDIFYGRAVEPDPLGYPETIVRQQGSLFTEYLENLYDAKLNSQPPIYTVDLPNPFSTSVSDQAGYYRVTRTEPALELIEE